MFTIKGEYTVKGRTFAFTKNVEAGSEKEAKEKVLSLIGSSYNAKRHLVKISEVKKE